MRSSKLAAVSAAVINPAVMNTAVIKTAVVSAVVVSTAALALAGCGSVSAARPGAAAPRGLASSSPAARTTSADPLSAAPAPDPAGPRPGFRVLSMSFVSDSSGFALGTGGCGRGRCVALLATTDGGARWRALTAPARAAGGPYNTCPSGQPCVQQVRFATPLTGYAFGPSLLVTTDGGLRWHRLRGAQVSSLEAADGTVTRVASAGTGCSGAPYRVDGAPVGSPAWRALPAPAITQICPPVLYRQGERLVLVGYGNPAGGVRATAQLDRSADGGQSWASGPDQCGGTDGYASAVALAPPDVLVLLCQHQRPTAAGGFRPAWVRVSTDGGASFGPDQTVPSLLAGPPGTVADYQLAAASAGALLVAETGPSGSRVLRTGTGGQSWSPVLSLRGGGTPVLVGFQDPVTARIARGDLVWTTRDGGRTWSADRF